MWNRQLFVCSGSCALRLPSGHSWHSCLRSIGHYSAHHLPAAVERQACGTSAEPHWCKSKRSQTMAERPRRACGNVAAAWWSAARRKSTAGLHAQLGTVGDTSERWSTGKRRWGGQIKGRTAELAPSSEARRRRIAARFTRTRKVMKKRARWRDCGATEEKHQSLKRSCWQLNEALTWKHFQVQRIHCPRGRKMKKITVNSGQLGVVGRRVCHAPAR